MPTIADLAARITVLEPSCGPVRLVAVDGPGGSGKTTFAGLLSGALNGAPVVHSDDFPIPWDQGPESWFGHLRRDVLEPLGRGINGRLLPVRLASGPPTPNRSRCPRPTW